ncbi:hypothetical protein M9458_052407 [Cirrhinus mrigala]|uniref:Myb/SANT-like DNA-binding domain-containing protein n=1 Tax=Cirrhinus mrigala TaxID=683832 RepID=A0ABD0MRL5_CIRMR
MAEKSQEDVFKWTDEHTQVLIRWRVANEALFTGKRNAAIKGFEAFVMEQGLQDRLAAAFVKKKWENLKQKYKDLKCPATGVSTEDGEPTAASWKWYSAMDEAIGGRPSITPPALIASSGPDVAVASTSSVSPDTSRKRTRKSLEDVIKEMEERESAREQEAVEREEKRWREKEEKEERRERARQEWEERRHAEDREREERWRQEANQREERLLNLLEIIAKK